MAVVLETTLGDITIDLYIDKRPKACINFLKLCKMKYYNFNLFHTVNQNFIAQTGDPTGSREGGESIWGVVDGSAKRFYEAENNPRIKHTTTGLVSFVGDKKNMVGSQFFITLANDLTYLDEQHCVFGEVTEGFDILRLLNEAICDNDHRPYQDIRITHTVILDDPFPDPDGIQVPDASPEPTAERLQGGRIAPDEEIDETMGRSVHEVSEIIADKEAKARATILEMIGDIPDAEMAPPENVLFVCKLNPVTNDDDLEIIFNRFGKIKSCEVIRDKKTGDSLQYAFVEFEDQKSCEDAYFKMDNVLIDDRRIHVDFSQSVAKVKWLGKGRGVTYFNEKGEKQRDDMKNDIGNGRYRSNQKSLKRERKERSRSRERSSSFSRQSNERQHDKKRRSRSRDRAEYYDRREMSNSYDRRRRSGDRPDYYDRRMDNRKNNRFRNDRYRRGGGGGGYDNRYQSNYSRYRGNFYKNFRGRDRNNYMQDRRRYNRSRSRERYSYYDNRSARHRSRSFDETENKKYEVEKRGERYKYEDAKEYDYKKKMKRNTESSNENISSEDEVKRTKKTKKSKKKKYSSSDSSGSGTGSNSDSDSDPKKSKKKKKMRKRKNSSESDNDSDSDAPRKRKNKKH